MPEGPSLVILREQAEVFEGRRILRVEGNTKIDTARLKGRTVQAVRTWGKHFLLELPTVALRIHLLMFGSYCIDARKPDKPLRRAPGRGTHRPAVRLERRRDVGALGPGARTRATARTPGHAGLRRAAGPGHLLGRGE